MQDFSAKVMWKKPHYRWIPYTSCYFFTRW